MNDIFGLKRREMFLNITAAVAVLVFFLCAFVASPAHAQSGIQLQPALIEDRVEPGTSITKELTVTNTGAGEQTYYLVTKDIDDVRDNGSPIFSENEETSSLDLSTWINVTSEPIFINGGESKKVPFTIDVPADATPGGHFGGIFVSLVPVRPDTVGTGVGYQVGSIISMQVAGEIVEVAQIREFTSDKSVYSSAKALFTARVENKGNVLVRPRGPLEIYDMFDKRVAIEIMNDDGGAVFPAAEREFQVEWEGEGLNFGRYTAILGLSYGQDVSKTIDQTITFWVLPMNIIGPILGGLLFVVILVYALVRMYIKNKIHAMGGGAAVNHYAHTKAPLSRLSVILVSLIVFTILFLMVLFFTMA